MRYLYHIDAHKESISLTGDEHRYIFKVRRHRVGEIIYLRNLEDDNLYSYEIVSIDKKSALLSLKDSRHLVVKASKSLILGWCVIDTKNIEKILPTLNEIGVEEINFIYCERSQKSFKIDFKRLNKILLNSSQQCGRSEMMRLSISSSLSEFRKSYPDSKMLNFSKGNFVDNNLDIESIVVGCEGGFSDDEIALFDSFDIVGFDTPLILKSESAVSALASKILL